MCIENYFTFDSKLSPSTFQVKPLGLDRVQSNDELAAEFHLLNGDYSNLTFPISFQHIGGSKLHDLLDTGWPSLYLVSDRMKTVLEENDMTGWKRFDIVLLDRQKKEIKGYHGFSITGRCGQIDFSKSEIFEKRLIPNGAPVKYYKGMYVGLDEWDETDFFLPSKYFGIIITERAATVLQKSKLTNIRLQNLAEKEMDYFTVQVALQKQS